MTGYTVHTGSNLKFSSNWDRIFGSGAGSTRKSAKAKASSQSAKSKKKKSGKR